MSKKFFEFDCLIHVALNSLSTICEHKYIITFEIKVSCRGTSCYGVNPIMSSENFQENKSKAVVEFNNLLPRSEKNCHKNST